MISRGRQQGRIFRPGWSETWGQAVRFVLVGGTNFLLTYAVYLALLPFARPVVAILVANAVGIFYTALLNIQVVFRASMKRALVLAVIAYYTLYAFVSAGLLEFAIRVLMIPAPFAPLAVLCFIIPINFLCSRLLVARAASEPNSPR